MNDKNIFEKLELTKSISLKHIVLDANFIIDSANYSELFAPFINYLKQNGATLTTISPVWAEILCGDRINTLQQHKEMIDFVGKIVDYTLPFDENLNEIALNKIIPVYGKAKAKAGIVDLYLAGTLMKYRSVILLTANHQDFPTFLFDRIEVIPVENEVVIRMFGLYKFSQEKYELAIKRLLAK